MSERPEVSYMSRRCLVRQRDVWAIATGQPAARRRIVNCLDKDRRCREQDCAFTRDGGAWPFADGSSVDPQTEEA